jgi:hypothetical protein
VEVLPIQETAFDAVPLMEEMFVNDPFYSLMDFEQSQNIVQGYHTFELVILENYKDFR